MQHEGETPRRYLEMSFTKLGAVFVDTFSLQQDECHGDRGGKFLPIYLPRGGPNRFLHCSAITAGWLQRLSGVEEICSFILDDRIEWSKLCYSRRKLLCRAETDKPKKKKKVQLLWQNLQLKWKTVELKLNSAILT